MGEDSLPAGAFQVNIGVKHVFSAELDTKKRQYILDCHQADHVYGDVIAFSNQRGHCYRCNCVHEINEGNMSVDIFLAGTSCKDISSLHEKLFFSLSFFLSIYLSIFIY